MAYEFGKVGKAADEASAGTLEEDAGRAGQSEALDKEKAVSACADLAYDHEEWIHSLLATTFNVTSVQIPGIDPEKTP